MHNATAGTVLGLQGPTTVIRRMINQTGGAVAAGDIVVCDEAQAVATTTDIGTTTSTETIVITPITATINHGRHGVCMTGAADGTELDVMFRGRINAATAAIVNEGDPLIAANGVRTLAAAASTIGGAKIIAVAKETTGGAGLADVAFDGLEGFGYDVAS